MPINELHPKYPEYAEKWNELIRRGKEESESVPYSGGLDGPHSAILKKYAKQLKALQKEYSYLFTDAD